jgi:2-aminoadipate transaminase
MAEISFARGAPAPECLPAAELADCAHEVLTRDGARVLSYGPGGGFGPLREWIAARHGVGVERVVLTNGSLQGFVFLVQHLLGERPRVLLEAPTYDRPLRILAAAGAHVVPLPLDDEGLDPDALAAELGSGSAPAFLYTIPTFQNPAGVTMAVERRRRVVELAAEHGLLVLEDDPYGLVRFEGDAPPTLHALDAEAGAEQVIHSSSFSKTIAPGLRVGYLVLPSRLAGALEAAAVSTYITPALLGQATVWEFVRRGLFEPNLERVCRLLEARRDAMLAGLESGFPSARWTRPEGGYFLWLDLPPGRGAQALLEEAAGLGVTFVPGRDFFPPGGEDVPSLRLAYSYASPAEISEGMGRLAGLVARAAGV